MEGYHKPVLLLETVEALKIQRGSWYLDCTLGDGGHSLEILKLGGNIVGIDVDPQALRRARERIEELGELEGLGKYSLIQGNFRGVKNLLEQMDLRNQKFEGVFFDLGVSSLQLEIGERGFSFMKEGPLDMRMDPALKVRALDLINAGGRKELCALFTKLGEEKNSYALADALVSARKIGRIETTKQLSEIVKSVVGMRGKTHPATRIFQALRIAVNDELNALQEGLDQVIDLIENYGRIAVLSFHSLEDRIVKTTFLRWQDQKMGKILTKKPIMPAEYEIRENPRSRSAKLRVFEVTYDYN